jgi:hypothetical protein
LKEVPVDDAQNKLPPAKGASQRPAAGENSQVSRNAKVPEHLSRSRRRKAGAPDGPRALASPANPASRQEKPPRPRPPSAAPQARRPRRKSRPSSASRGVPDLHLEADGEGSDQHHRLVARMHTVSRSDIDKKWAALDNSSITAIASIIADAERSVLVRVPERNNKRDLAELAMAAVSRRLKAKLIKGMPFPPPLSKIVSSGARAGRRAADVDTRKNVGSHDEELNFERTINNLQSLQALLDPLQHSLLLLQQEKVQEDIALESDYDTLHALENDARAQARDWEQRGRQSHALAPTLKRTRDGLSSPEAKSELLLTPETAQLPTALFSVSGSSFFLCRNLWTTLTACCRLLMTRDRSHCSHS